MWRCQHVCNDLGGTRRRPGTSHDGRDGTIGTRGRRTCGTRDGAAGKRRGHSCTCGACNAAASASERRERSLSSARGPDDGARAGNRAAPAHNRNAGTDGRGPPGPPATSIDGIRHARSPKHAEHRHITNAQDQEAQAVRKIRYRTRTHVCLSATYTARRGGTRARSTRSRANAQNERPAPRHIANHIAKP